MSTFSINGKSHTFDGDPSMPLLWFLRDIAGMTGTKFGCGVGLCGACTVILNGEPIRSCQTSIADLSEDDILTIEGANSKTAKAVQTAWDELNVVQCGYCQPGQIMQAIGLLSSNAKPSTSEIDDYMAGNVCRCAAYQRIRAAVERAAEIMEA